MFTFSENHTGVDTNELQTSLFILRTEDFWYLRRLSCPEHGRILMGRAIKMLTDQVFIWGLLGHRSLGAKNVLSAMVPFPDMILSQQEHKTDQLY